jgi:hypothetical protein
VVAEGGRPPYHHAGISDLDRTIHRTSLAGKRRAENDHSQA